MQQQASLHPFGHGGDVKTAAEAYGFDPQEIVDFSANINPLGLPAGLLAYLTEQFETITAYPDPACRKLISVLKEYYQPRHSLVAGNGAGELIYTLMRILPAGIALIPAPSFNLYARAAQAAGRPVSYHYLQREHEFRLQVEQICQQIRQERPAVVILCNPNNPTGCGLTRDEILAVSEACAEINAYLVIDEAFLEFAPDWEERTLLQMAPEHLLVLCSMTKMYAIPGLRLGFLAAPSQLCEAVQNNRDPWSVNALAQLAGEFVLRDKTFVQKSVEVITAEARALYQTLQTIPDLHPFVPGANYILLESLQLSSTELQEELLKQKVLIRDCGNYQGLDQHYVRVAVRSRAENQILLEAFRNRSQS